MKSLFTGIIVAFFIFAGPTYAEVNINTATQAELETLPGIGPAKARAIVEYRDANGKFVSVDGLSDVDGVGQGTMKQLRNSITVNDMTNPETKSAMVHQE